MFLKVDTAEVKMWVEKLRNSKTDEEAAKAASELSHLSIRTRGSVRTRGGGISRAAVSEFPPEIEKEAMSAVIESLKSRSPAVRREVVFSLGEWGNEDAAIILKEMLVGDKQDPEGEVRRAGMAALGTIGGMTAVRTLCKIAETDPSSSIRYDALAALNELVPQEPAATVQGPKAIRTRGSVVRPRAGLGMYAKEVVTTLRRIRDKESEREHIRRMAEAVLASLAQ